MSKRKHDDDDDKDGSPNSRPAKKARVDVCDPASGAWCTACRTTLETGKALGHPATWQDLVQTEHDGCPYQCSAYVVGALGLRYSAPVKLSALLQLESVSSEHSESAEEEEEPWAPPPVEPLNLPFVERIPDADENPNETLEERMAYEDQFDREYAEYCRVPRATKRALLRRLWPNRGFQQRNVHPDEKRVVMEPEEHQYFIDRNPEHIISVSTIIHTMFEPFDGPKIAVHCVGKGRTQHCTTIEEVLATWDKSRDNGTAFHAAIENTIRAERDKLIRWKTSNVVAEAPPAFFNFMDRYAFLRFVRCELTLMDPDSRICGQADAVAVDSRTGEYWLLDWKNTHAIRTRGYGKFGQTPFTAAMEDCNFSHYTLQFNMYAYLIEKMLGWKIAHMLLVNFCPDDLGADAEPQLYPVPSMDIRPIMDERAAYIKSLSM